MMRAARIEDGVVVDLWEVPSLDCYGDLYTLIEAPEWVEIGATWDGVNFVNPICQPKSLEDTIMELSAKVKERLDDFARSRGHTDINSACTFAISTNPDFALEGRYCMEVRDATWAKFYEVINEVQSGQRKLPTWEEFEVEFHLLV